MELEVEALDGFEEVDGRSFPGHVRQLKGVGIMVHCKPLVKPYLNVFA
jgi:hypothetical protein